LASYFSDVSVRIPTKAAFSKLRASLSYKVFKRLNLWIVNQFYQQGNYKKWKGFRILAIDGSTLQLPDHPSLTEKFSRHAFGAQRSVDRWMSRVSFLYDVLNKVVIDAQMESFKTSEAELCRAHLGFLRKGDLVTFDRYYASHYLFSVLQHKHVHFLFRMRDHSWRCVKEFIAAGLSEQIVDVEVYPYSPVAKRIPANVDKKVRIRLIRQVSRSGEVRVYATSLLDTAQYSQTAIINLYRKRWGVEEAFKTLKARLDVVHFSGKTVHAVQQDFYAKVLLISLTSVLKFDLQPNLKRKTKTENKHRRTPIINNSFAISQTKTLLKRMQFIFDQLDEWLYQFSVRVRANIEYSRVGSSSPRTKDKGRLRSFNQNYKYV
jgi:hypothetical protein